MSSSLQGLNVLVAIGAVAVAASITAGLIVLTRPLLVRYALARPNARSSHSIPTPQGGGIAVVAATLLVSIGLSALMQGPKSLGALVPVLAGSIILGILGAIDDIKAVGVAPRIALQAAVITWVIVMMPELQVIAFVPSWLQTVLLVVAGVWFVNLVNFMDGLDLMTVAEVVPITAAIVLLAMLGILPHSEAAVSLSLLGAILGFARFNKPVARIFLGDVGSLPIGLLLGWLLLGLASRGHVVAALLLPLYYLADASITLFRRLLKGERITQAHRSHYYQRATDRKLSVQQIVSRVFGTNIVLAILAIISVLSSSWITQASVLGAGALVVGLLLRSFVQGEA